MEFINIEYRKHIIQLNIQQNKPVKNAYVMSQSKLQWFEIEHKKRMKRHYKDKKKMKQTRTQKPRLTLYLARNTMKNLK